ncbi:uncharacterized protein AC631_05934 [Debaryomyces fabryi]|uniref:Uncharacterized protein n=1 Tax=Debaryomyces fabryi TaxID=58627 RepID=A0A0V1PQ58_9ASCO|nr:uncharacterized protein AC631_05934 [Debaryomyces fabryi]KRZ98305.1 hypothetical protein AC631_05934 [Debaryomyces fabryi]CUM56809.1 unnamed protein product [Debaryomyces fabryi]
MLYIVGRVDLRFYKPGKLLPLDEMVTAKQFEVSDDSLDLNFNRNVFKMSVLKEKIMEDSFQDCGSSDFHF